MRALIDGDILRYEIGFAGEAAAKAKYAHEEDPLPDWEWVENILWERMNRIFLETYSNDYIVFLTAGRCFRYDIATVKPYKGTRVSAKPWHFANITAVIAAHFNCQYARPGLEADDEMAIAQTAADGDTIICSRDKDLRQVNGWYYSWELGKQSRIGPVWISDENSSVMLSNDRRTLGGKGRKFFYGQLLVGDTADNIPGLEKCGPVKAASILTKGQSMEEAWKAVCNAYQERYAAAWKERLEEQGQLLMLLSRMDGDVIPLWTPDLETQRYE